MHHNDVEGFRKAALASSRAFKAMLFCAAVWASLAVYYFLMDRPLLGLFQCVLSCSHLYIATLYHRSVKAYDSLFAKNARLCPKCKSGMEEGFLMENGHYSSPSAEASFVGSAKGSVTHHVHTYRCVACGYLESYTR
jgi:hypothetical protein